MFTLVNAVEICKSMHYIYRSTLLPIKVQLLVQLYIYGSLMSSASAILVSNDFLDYLTAVN